MTEEQSPVVSQKQTKLANYEQKKIIWSRLGYYPSPEQERIHRDPCRQILVAGGWQAGKSFSAAKEVIAQAFFSDLIWLVGPDYDQCIAEWNYIKADALALGLVEPENISDPTKGAKVMTLTFGSPDMTCEIRTKTANDPVTLGSFAPNFILACEAAQMEYQAYINLRGRIAPRRGKLLLTGTFEAAGGWYNRLFDTWSDIEDQDIEGHAYSLPSWSNRNLYPLGREDPEILALERQLDEDEFKEKIAGEPALAKIMVFPTFDAKIHVGEQYDYNPSYPVKIAVDPGHQHAYSVLFIQEYDIEPYGRSVVVFDELYEFGQKSDEMIDKAMAKPYWSQVTGGVIDVSAHQHLGQDSNYETWLNRTGLKLDSRKIPVVDGIDRHRTYLINPATKLPRLFHHPRCQGIISEYGKYRYRRQKDDMPVREEPIDRHNDSLKALSYYLVINHGYTDVIYRSREPLCYRKHVSSYSRMAGRIA